MVTSAEDKKSDADEEAPKTPYLKTGLKVLLLVVVVTTPPVVAAVLWWPAATLITVIGVTVGMVGAAGRGFPAGIRLALIFAVAGAIATEVTNQPILATALVMVMSVLVALSAVKGASGPMMIAAVFIPYIIHAPAENVSITGEASSQMIYILSSFVALLLGGAYGAFVAVKLVKLPAAPTTPQLPSVPQATLVGILLALSTGAVTFVAMTWFPEVLWMWITLTIYILTRPTLELDFKKIRDRFLGTVLGVIFAVVIVDLVGFQSVFYILGVLFITAALTLSLLQKPYWIYAGLLTPAIVFFGSAGKDVDLVGGERVAFTAIGVVIALLIGLVTNLVVRAAGPWLEDRTTRGTEPAATADTA
ncbi:MAG: FUSC family protein [Actinobacteria bacterium]|nr:FUSC family protein [Actinomycetota bacterium]